MICRESLETRLDIRALLKKDSAAMDRITKKLPVDSAVLDDTIEASLCKGEIIQVRSRFMYADVLLTE
jgi:hypothetical protein